MFVDKFCVCGKVSYNDVIISEKIFGDFLPIERHPIYTPLNFKEFCFKFATVETYI
jgi:hypothetical protein